MPQDRFYDPKFSCYNVNVAPGNFYVTDKNDEMISTVLGSCVAACIRNPITGLGGLNHFLLAEPGESVTSPSNRYGSFAMEQLINEILKHGGKRSLLEVKVFGGSHLLNNSHRIGDHNIDFIHRYLSDEGIPIKVEDVGGERPRKIHYWPSTGKVMRLLIAPTEIDDLRIVETKYKNNLVQKQIGESIEIYKDKGIEHW
jgi:chemotaxis protein CheD